MLSDLLQWVTQRGVRTLPSRSLSTVCTFSLEITSYLWFLQRRRTGLFWGHRKVTSSCTLWLGKFLQHSFSQVRCKHFQMFIVFVIRKNPVLVLEGPANLGKTASARLNLSVGSTQEAFVSGSTVSQNLFSHLSDNSRSIFQNPWLPGTKLKPAFTFLGRDFAK